MKEIMYIVRSDNKIAVIEKNGPGKIGSCAIIEKHDMEKVMCEMIEKGHAEVFPNHIIEEIGGTTSMSDTTSKLMFAILKKHGAELIE